MPRGGTRPGEEVRDGSHSDNRCGCDRGGVAPTAAPLKPQAGARRVPAFIMLLSLAALHGYHPILPRRGLRSAPPLCPKTYCAADRLIFRLIVSGGLVPLLGHLAYRGACDPYSKVAYNRSHYPVGQGFPVLPPDRALFTQSRGMRILGTSPSRSSGRFGSEVPEDVAWIDGSASKSETMLW
jgi:hypothetical protein